ncbi:MAG: hypothetical protein KDJ47_09985 [Hyphomicrobiaceae bacterium]|nr:hypothetical protein [Hyphomicrobiaceae bacterium]
MRRAVTTVCTLLVWLGFYVATASAQTNCNNINNATLASSTSITATPAYQPFSGSQLTHSFNLTVQNSNSSACSIAIILVRSTSPVVMSNGSFSLGYNIDFNGTPVVNIGTPSTGFYATAPGNGTATFSSYNLTIAANQTSAAAGAYTDTQVAVYLYAFRSNRWNLVRTYAMNFSAFINKTCVMSAPSPSTLNFTSAISLGIPNPAVGLSSTLPGVHCTSPSKITLTGNAMQHVPAVGTVSGFDSLINWQATATLGSATAMLSTNTASTVTSAGYNVPSGTTVGGSVGVNVNLIAGQRLRSGNYTGVLTVTLDPTL